MVFLPRGGLPPGAEAGYVYDWIRQWQKERGRKQKTKEKAEKESQKTNQEKETKYVKDKTLPLPSPISSWTGDLLLLRKSKICSGHRLNL